MSILQGLQYAGQVAGGAVKGWNDTQEELRKKALQQMQQEQFDRQKKLWAEDDAFKAGLENVMKPRELEYVKPTSSDPYGLNFEASGYRLPGAPNEYYDSDSGQRAKATFNAPEARNQRVSDYLISKTKFNEAAQLGQLDAQRAEAELRPLRKQTLEQTAASGKLALEKQQRIASAEKNIEEFDTLPVEAQLARITDAKLPYGAMLSPDGNSLFVVDQKNPKKMKAVALNSPEGMALLDKGRELYRDEILGAADKDYAFKVRKERNDRLKDQEQHQERLASNARLAAAYAGKKDQPAFAGLTDKNEPLYQLPGQMGFWKAGADGKPVRATADEVGRIKGMGAEKSDLKVVAVKNPDGTETSMVQQGNSLIPINVYMAAQNAPPPPTGASQPAAQPTGKPLSPEIQARITAIEDATRRNMEEQDKKQGNRFVRPGGGMETIPEDKIRAFLRGGLFGAGGLMQSAP